MKSSTFHYQQDLRSSEFGTLLRDLLPSGIYKAPSLALVASGSNYLVRMTGGRFLLYNSSDDYDEFAIRVSYDDDETLDSLDTVSTANLPAYVYLTYTYSSVLEVSPELRVATSLPTDTEYIHLGTVFNTSNGYVIETAYSDLRGAGYTYPQPLIKSLEYNPSTSTLTVEFQVYVQSNSALSVPSTYTNSSVSTSTGYALYIDQNGEPQLIEGYTEDYPSQGRNILAYKLAGENFFTTFNYFPERAELTADSLYLASASQTQSTTELNSIYTSSSNSNTQGAILSKVVQRLVTEVQALREELGETSDTSSESSLYGRLKAAEETLTANKSSFTTSSLTVTSSATFSGSVDFTDANFTFSNTNFGTRTNPVTNLYVTGVLYADDVQLLTT